MKKIIAFLFILISAYTYAQDTTKVKTKKTKRFFVGVNFAPEISYRTIHNNGGNSDNWLVKFRDSIEIPKFGFTTGINFDYIVSKHISIEAGIQYSNKGYQTKESALVFDNPRGGGYNIPISGKFIYTYNYLDIPLKVNFAFGKKKTQFITSVGLTTNILLKATNTFVGKYSNGTPIGNSSNITDEYNRINLSPTISCGIQYNLSNKLFFKIEPTFRYGVLKMADAPITQYIWNAGLNLSLYFL